MAPVLNFAKLRIKTMQSLVTVAAAGVFLTGCENQPTEVEDYVPDTVLSAFIYCGEPVNEIYLERVGSFQRYYDPADYGITGADMILIDMERADTLRLMDDPDEPGRYMTPNTEWLPRPTVTYRLEASFGDEFIWAETVVPGDYILNVLPEPVNGDTLTREDDNLIFTWTGSDSTGGYAMNIISLAPRDSLVPLDPDWDPEEDEIEDEDKYQSGVWTMRDDQRVQTLPWIAFGWEGPYRIDFMAVPQIYYDYIFAGFRAEQNIAVDIPTNVHGGIGIFAGLNRRSFSLYMAIAEGE